MATSANETRVPILPSEHSKSLMQNNAPPSGVKVGELSNTAAVVTSLVAGAVAGAIAKTVIAPLDRTKINFQISNTAYSWRAALAFLRESARRSGASALWRGNSATLARIAPYAAIQFSAHEQYKRALRVHEPEAAKGYTATVLGVIPYAGVSFFTYDSLKHAYLERVGEKQGSLANLAFGSAAGVLGQTASYPLDIVRRRMQTARRRGDGSYPHPTIAATLARVYRTEGVRGFFKGLSMNWVKGPLAVGISFATYDAIKSSLQDTAVALHW